MKINYRIKSWFLIILILSTSLMLVGFSTMDSEEHHHHVLIAKLSGAGGGDSDGKGKAKITIMMDDKGNHTLCWDIRAKNITLPAIAAHIHLGVKGATGPIVVTLSAPNANGYSSGCTSISHDLAMSLHMNPEQYYVNVHTADYPGGAVRGQLTLAED